MNIGERITLLLKNEKKRESDLAKYLNTRQSTVQNWTKRSRSPSAEMIMPICEFFGVTPLYLLTGNEIEPPTKEQLKEWTDPNKNTVTAPDDQSELSRLRINDALTKRIEEVIEEAWRKNQPESKD